MGPDVRFWIQGYKFYLKRQDKVIPSVIHRILNTRIYNTALDKT